MGGGVSRRRTSRSEAEADISHPSEHKIRQDIPVPAIVIPRSVGWIVNRESAASQLSPGASWVAG